MNYFGKINSSEQIVTTDNEKIGYIKMTCERPTPEHIANDKGEWILAIASLEELKAEKRIELDALTGQKITGGFYMQVNDINVKFDSDIETQITMQGIAINANTDDFKIKYPDGAPVRGIPEGKTEKEILMLDGPTIIKFCANLSEHIGLCKQHGWELQQAVDLAENEEMLNNIKW